MSHSTFVFTQIDTLQQKKTEKDTLFLVDESFKTQVKAMAKDSMFHDIKNEKIYLFGEAKVYYEDMQLEADFIVVDLKISEATATYTFDKDSNKVGIPKFKDGEEEIIAHKIRYNFETEKGFLEQIKIKQDENYLHMEKAKKLPNEHIHFRGGKFTSCDLEEPHFHLFLSKAILIPDKRIVSGPMNMWVQGVPTPLGLPFALIPQKKIEERNTGFIFPEYTLQSAFGMGFQNLGYYLPINDSIDQTFFGDLYTKGSWGLKSETNYKIKYRFDGNFRIGYQHFNTGFPFNSRSNKLSVNWYHKQDQKANPYWNFSSNVNFMSDNSPKTSLDPVNENYFDNSLNSDINISRNFPGKPITSGMKISVRQNSKSNNFAVTSPSFNLNVTRFSPFGWIRKDKVGSKKWYEQIAMTYNFEGQNRSSFHDSLLKNNRFDLIGKTFLNGIQQSSTMQTTVGIFKNTWKLNPSMNYSNRINFQQIRKKYDQINNNTETDTISKIGLSHQLSFNMQVTSALYSYYRIIGKNKPLLRHILTPSFGFRYTPSLYKGITDSVGVNKSVITYSAYERSLYQEGISKESGQLTFGFNNTFEVKHKSPKDTISGFKKTRIIDALSFNGSFDFLKDTMKLSNISSSMRISPVDFLSFVANATFSPYDWDDKTNLPKKELAITTRSKLARLSVFSINSEINLTSKSSREKVNQNQKEVNQNWNSDLSYFALHPYDIIDFEIPWKLSLSHLFDVNRIIGLNNSNEKFNMNNTVNIKGDISITKRWKVISDLYFDVKTKKVINTRLSITRDMHCWNLSLNWVPIGLNQSFLLRISANSRIFQNAKMELRKPPVLQ